MRRGHKSFIPVFAWNAILNANSAQAANPARVALDATRYVDPAGVVSGSSDLNTGANPTNSPPGTGPIRTTNELNRRLFNRYLTGDTTITYLSDDASGQLLNYGTMDFDQHLLTFQGTPQVLHTGGTLNAGTVAINPTAPGGGQRQTAHTTDVADFHPYEFNNGGTALHPSYLMVTSGGNTGTRAWIVSGTATASVSRPVAAGVAGAGTLTSGDPYVIRRGSELTLDTINTPAGIGTSGAATFKDFAFLSNTSGSIFDNYVQCSWDTFVTNPGNAILDSYLPDDLLTSSPVTIVAGVVFANGNGTVTGLMTVSSDVYITGSGATLGVLNWTQFFVQAGFGAGAQFQDCTSTDGAVNVASTSEPCIFLGGSLLWGNGNAGYGMFVDSGATFETLGGAFVPSVTGNAGDIAFFTPNTGAVDATARAMVAGAYLDPPRAATWTLLTTAIGSGGFGGAMLHPETNSAIIAL